MSGVTESPPLDAPITVLLDTNLRTGLEQVARINQRTLSAEVRLALRVYVESCLGTFERLYVPNGYASSGGVAAARQGE